MYKFVWYDSLQVTRSVPNSEKSPPPTTTMWYKPSGTELHKYVTVTPSLLTDAGYGLFAEREF